MRKLLLIIILLIVPVQGWGANWFAGAGDTDFNAVSGGTTSSVWNSNADGTSGTYLDWSTQPANGDIFIANGVTGIAIDDNIGSGSVTVTLTTEGTDYGGTDGGTFTMDIGTNSGKTLYTNITAGSTDCLTLTDAADATDGTLTIIGNVTGGGSTNADGIVDARVDAQSTLTIGSSGTPTSIVGGSGATAHGLFKSASNGIIAVVGNCQSGTGAGSTGHGLNAVSYSATVTIDGDCIANGSGTNMITGCYGSTSGTLTISGNIIGNANSFGALGKFVWSPSAATKYIKIIGDGTPAAYYLTSNIAGGAHPAVTDVKSGVEYGWDSGASDHFTGTLAGGGGAWAQ